MNEEYDPYDFSPYDIFRMTGGCKETNCKDCEYNEECQETQKEEQE